MRRKRWKIDMPMLLEGGNERKKRRVRRDIGVVRFTEVETPLFYSRVFFNFSPLGIAIYTRLVV
jgi:hypothetical protein